MLKGVEGEGQGAGRAVGAETHVHPEYEAFGGFGVQRLDESLSQTYEVFAGSFVSGTFYRTIVRVDENQIDIGRKIQFLRAQFAHAQDDQGLVPAIGGFRHAPFPPLPGVKDLERFVHAHVGQFGKVFQGLVQVGLARQVPPRDAYHLFSAEAAQAATERMFVGFVCG